MLGEKVRTIFSNSQSLRSGYRHSPIASDAYSESFQSMGNHLSKSPQGKEPRLRIRYQGTAVSIARVLLLASGRCECRQIQTGPVESRMSIVMVYLAPNHHLRVSGVLRIKRGSRGTRRVSPSSPKLQGSLSLLSSKKGVVTISCRIFSCKRMNVLFPSP